MRQYLLTDSLPFFDIKLLTAAISLPGACQKQQLCRIVSIWRTCTVLRAVVGRGKLPKEPAPRITLSMLRGYWFHCLCSQQLWAVCCSTVIAGSDREDTSCRVRHSLARVHRVSQIPCLQAWLQPLSVVDWKILQGYCLQALFCAGRWTRPDSSVINTPKLGLDQVS